MKNYRKNIQHIIAFLVVISLTQACQLNTPIGGNPTPSNSNRLASNTSSNRASSVDLINVSCRVYVAGGGAYNYQSVTKTVFGDNIIFSAGGSFSWWLNGRDHIIKIKPTAYANYSYLSLSGSTNNLASTFPAGMSIGATLNGYTWKNLNTANYISICSNTTMPFVPAIPNNTIKYIVFRKITGSETIYFSVKIQNNNYISSGNEITDLTILECKAQNYAPIITG